MTSSPMTLIVDLAITAASQPLPALAGGLGVVGCIAFTAALVCGGGRGA